MVVPVMSSHVINASAVKPFIIINIVIVSIVIIVSVIMVMHVR